MDRIDAMRIFVAVAEARGFAAAARRLRVSPPAVTRSIAALEDRIGARLLHRTTRVVRLTESGAGFLDDCKRILAELDDAERSAAGTHGEPRGVLVVTAPVMFGKLHVTPIVLDFLARHPRVQVRVAFTDRVIDLVEDGIDVAIRIAHVDARSYDHARPVAAVRRLVCAAPSLIAAHGEPADLAALERMPAIGFASDAAAIAWSFEAGGATRTIRPVTRLIVNSTEAAVEAAIAGHGAIIALSYQVARPLRSGRLRRLLRSIEPPPIPIHVVHRDGRRAPARVRAFVDFAAERLRADRSLDDAAIAATSP